MTAGTEKQTIVSEDTAKTGNFKQHHFRNEKMKRIRMKLLFVYALCRWQSSKSNGDILNKKYMHSKSHFRKIPLLPFEPFATEKALN